MAGTVQEWGALTERERVELWREQVAVGIGCTVDQALFVRNNPQIDIHSLSAIVAKGCPVHLALRILS